MASDKGSTFLRDLSMLGIVFLMLSTAGVLAVGGVFAYWAGVPWVFGSVVFLTFMSGWLTLTFRRIKHDPMFTFFSAIGSGSGK